MKVINVESMDQLESLGSALTFEGLDTSDESLNSMLDWIKTYTKMKYETIYVTKGSQMNDWYELSGDNAYNKDLSIVSVDLKDLENPSAITLPRFNVGGRWLDDVIDNNVQRQKEMNGR